MSWMNHRNHRSWAAVRVLTIAVQRMVNVQAGPMVVAVPIGHRATVRYSPAERSWVDRSTATKFEEGIRLVRTRIVTLAVLAATLAVTLFGLPLAFGVAEYAYVYQRLDLERIADVVALKSELAHDEAPGPLPDMGGGTVVGVYDQRGV